MCAIYAFMRYCDDISEGEGASREGIERWRRDLDLALEGQYGENLLWPAFHDTVQRYRIPHEYFYQMIEGVSSDLQPKQLQTFDELYRYCYQVASVVGLTIIHIFGFESPDALLLAEKCGIAFQLTNILRDVREDRENGRIYLPEEDIRKFGADLAKHDERFVRLMSFEAQRARAYYDESRPLDRAGARPQPAVAVGADRDLPAPAREDRALQFRCARKAHPRPDLGKAEHFGQRSAAIALCNTSGVETHRATYACHAHGHPRALEGARPRAIFPVVKLLFGHRVDFRSLPVKSDGKLQPQLRQKLQPLEVLFRPASLRLNYGF